MLRNPARDVAPQVLADDSSTDTLAEYHPSPVEPANDHHEHQVPDPDPDNGNQEIKAETYVIFE